MTKFIITIAAVTSLISVTTAAQAHRSPSQQTTVKTESIKQFLDRRASERGR